jgi:cyclopropane-fatty-acyl-phospholipid synthase
MTNANDPMLRADHARPSPIRANGPADRSDAMHLVQNAPCQGESGTATLLRHLFRRFEGSLAMRLWDGSTILVGKPPADEASTAFTLILCNPCVVRTLVLGRDPLRVAEAYFHGEIDIEGDFFAALVLKDHLQSIGLSWRGKFAAAFKALQLPSSGRDLSGPDRPRKLRHARTSKANSKAGDRAAIQFHYDVSNAFYALWLDQAMVYSCAYFQHKDQSLDLAQMAKLEHICRKLQLRPNDRFLDIGCGWGALVIHAARHFGVRAHGITLSRQQFELAQQRVEDAGLADRVIIELRDYRDVPGDGAFDKIASVGMFEHVGLQSLPAYFATVHRLLKPGGLFLNHGITHDVEGWEKTLSTTFINRYVFPDGQLDTVSNIQRGMERARFEICDVEALRPHYALTLRHWVARLERQHAQVLEQVDESTYRVWRLYMAACALEFESGEIGVYQVLARKRTPGAVLPLTRHYMYPAESTTKRELN